MPRPNFTPIIVSAVPKWPATIRPKEVADAHGIKLPTAQGTLARLDKDPRSDIRAVGGGAYSRAVPSDVLDAVRAAKHVGSGDSSRVDPDRLVYDANGGRRAGDAGLEEDVVTYSAGKGTQAVRRIVRTRAEIETTTGYKADALIPVYVEGDSMLPLIRPNSLAFALPLTRIEGPGIYAFEIEGRRIVKHIDTLLGGVLRVTSRNREAYPDAEELEPMPKADTPNTYRSRTTGQTGVVRVTGRIVAFTQVT